MKCPNCDATLVMADRQGVEIDYCPSCRGVWLDRGELDKILERSGQIKYDKPEADYYDRRDDDYYKKHPNYHHKKKRGFLGDFFDFD